MTKIVKNRSQRKAEKALNQKLKILRSQRSKITWLIRKIKADLKTNGFRQE